MQSQSSHNPGPDGELARQRAMLASLFKPVSLQQLWVRLLLNGEPALGQRLQENPEETLGVLAHICFDHMRDGSHGESWSEGKVEGNERLVEAIHHMSTTAAILAASGRREYWIWGWTFGGPASRLYQMGELVACVRVCNYFLGETWRIEREEAGLG